MLQSSAMLQSVCQPPAAVVRQNLKVVHVNIGQGQSGYCGSSQARTDTSYLVAACYATAGSNVDMLVHTGELLACAQYSDRLGIPLQRENSPPPP